AHHRLEVIPDEGGVGADRLQRARHDPFLLAPPRRREVALLRVPLGMILVPITHDLIEAATVHAARLVARLLDEVTEERGAWRKRHVVDIAVQGLVHSEDELCHSSPSQVLQKSSSHCDARAGLPPAVVDRIDDAKSDSRRTLLKTAVIVNNSSSYRRSPGAPSLPAYRGCARQPRCWQCCQWSLPMGRDPDPTSACRTRPSASRHTSARPWRAGTG